MKRTGTITFCIVSVLVSSMIFAACNQESAGSTAAAEQDSSMPASENVSAAVTTAVTTEASETAAVSEAATLEVTAAAADEQLQVQLLEYLSEHGDWETDRIQNFHHEEDQNAHYHCSFNYEDCQYECYVDASTGEVTDCHHIDEEEGRHHVQSEHESVHSHESHHSDHHDR